MYNLIKDVKKLNLLVIYYINNVIINYCVNVILVVGVSFFMSFLYEEVEEMVSVVNFVVINIGIMNLNMLDLFLLVGKVVNKYNKFVVLDLVGVFVSKVRVEFISRFLNEVKFSVVKGNVLEIKFIGGFNVKGKGVDLFDEEEDFIEIIRKIVEKFECVVVVIGKIDIIINGKGIYKINNGIDKLKGIIGIGCMIVSLIVSFMVVIENILEVVIMGVFIMFLSGELVNLNNLLIGIFKENFMNVIY